MAWNWRRWRMPTPRPRGRARCATYLAILSSAGFVVLGCVYQNDIRLPPNTRPWAPVDLNAAPGWIAHWQLGRLAADSQRCRTALATTREIFTPVKDRKIDQGCGLNDVVRTDHSPIAFSPRTTATCGLTAALIWYQAALQDVALSQMHTRLIRVDQLGTFACRNVNSEAIGSHSQHATANAIDIAAFHFANGRTITVARDYGADTPEGGRASSALGGRYLHIFLTARTLPLRAFYQEMARP